MRILNSGRSTLNRNLESSVDTLPWLSLNAHPAATFQQIGWRVHAFCRQTSRMYLLAFSIPPQPTKPHI